MMSTNINLFWILIVAVNVEILVWFKGCVRIMAVVMNRVQILAVFVNRVSIVIVKRIQILVVNDCEKCTNFNVVANRVGIWFWM